MKKTFLLMICFSISMIIPLSAMAAEPIKVAAIFPKSGDGIANSVFSFRGVSLAAEEINAQGGILGRQMEIIELDNRTTPIGSKIAASKAVRHDVTAVIGAGWSSNSLAMAPILQKAGIPMITSVSTNPKVTLEGNYIFRVCFTDPFQGKIMAQFAIQDLSTQTAVIMTKIDSDYSMGVSQYFKDAFLREKGKILAEEKYLRQTMDFTDSLEKIRALKPDAVYVPGHSRDSSFLIRQAAKLGIRTHFLGGDGWDIAMLKFAGKAAEGNYYSHHWHSEVPYPSSRKLLADYYRKYGKGFVSSMCPLAYDAVMVLADAIRRAQSTDRKQIRDALASTKAFKGATGTITFDENGDPLNKEGVILTFADGKVAFVKSVKP